MKTALLIGGNSPEREVSLMSGGAVADALRRLALPFVEFAANQVVVMLFCRHFGLLPNANRAC